MAYDYSNPNLGSYLTGIQGLTPVKNGKGYATGLYRAGDYIYGPGFANIGQSGSGENYNEGTTDYSKPTYLTRMKASDWDARGVDEYGNKLDANDGTYHDFIDPETGQYLYSDFEGNGDKEVSFGRFLEAAAKTWLAGYGATQAFGPAAGGEGGASAGGFVGEGASSGVPAWDSAGFTIPEGASFTPATAGEMDAMGLGATSGGGFVGEGAASGVPAWDSAGSGGAEFGEGVSLPGHELTHSAGQIGGLGGSSAGGGFLNGAKSLFGGGGMGEGFNWSSLIGPAISAVGGAYSANQARGAADAQLQAAREAQAKLEPWYQAGGNALTRLQEQLGIGGNKNAADYGSAAKDFSMADYQADPGLAFRRQQGEQGLQRAAAASGSLGSGKYLKDAMSFNSGLASQEFNNAFNRFQTSRTNRLNPLQSLAGQGQSTAQLIGDLSTQGGNAIAAGKVGTANALTNAIGQGWSMYQNNQQQNQNNALMNYLMQR